MKSAVIFGGTGFLGVFFSEYLLQKSIVDKIYLIDMEDFKAKKSHVFRKNKIGKYENIVFINADVREPLHIDIDKNDEVTLIANFAAIHREPGHNPHEYYETNLLGAENVCNWARQIKCNTIIFSSSISPYGLSIISKNENSIPVPNSPYGGSKLASEKIHQIWQSSDRKNRNLIIVRPGVIFGPSEGGNVSRLIKAIKGSYFFYMGNKKTRKAGIYIKELCCAIIWVLEEHIEIDNRSVLFNATMNPGPSIEEYVEAIKKVLGVKRYVLGVPYSILYASAFLIDLFLKPLKIKHPFSTVRIKKLIHPNNIEPKFLADNKYEYQYKLEDALADWKNENPAEW